MCFANISSQSISLFPVLPGFFFSLLLAVPCSTQNPSSQQGIKSMLPAAEAWSPNHWTAREIRLYMLLMFSFEVQKF